MTLDRTSRVAAVLSAILLAAGWLHWDSVAVGAERLLPLLIGFAAAILPQLGRVGARVLSSIGAAALGLEVHAGHGIDYETVQAIAAIPEVAELNIGHFLIGEAIFVGLAPAIARMRALMDDARAPNAV